VRQLFAALLSAAVLAGCVPASQSGGVPPAFARRGDKEVVCIVEPMPNYLTHLTAVAGVPWPTAYADLQGQTVDVESHHILRTHATLLQWGREYTGDLAPFFVLLPAYLPLDDRFDLFEYLQALDEAMKDGSYEPLARLHPGAQSRLRLWLFDFRGFFESRAGDYRTYLRSVRQLIRVYETNYQAWDEEVWRDAQARLDVVAAELNGDIWSLDLLSRWEDLTGERYRGTRFDVVLSEAPTGTGITGLGYHRSLLSTWDTDRERMLGLIVHEVGTHVLIDLFKEISARQLAAGQPEWKTHAAFAGLTAHYTRQILPHFETDIENEVEIFAGLYRQIADEEPRAGARRLVTRALADYRPATW
jgi:hypothetical protein